MSLRRDEIARRAQDVLAQFSAARPVAAPPAAALGPDGLFSSVDEAVAAAKDGQRQFRDTSLATRKEIIAQMRLALRREAEALAFDAREETGLGRYEDKIEKNLLVIDKTPGPEDLEPMVTTGDHGLTLTELAAFGVVAAVTPTTNPVATIINNSISLLSGGNSVVFNPHPNAKRCSARAVQIVNQAILAAGGPANVVTAITTPTIETAQTLMRHKDIRLNLVTGGPAVVKEAMAAGKRAICAGPGNPPVVVDETADVEKAGADIVRGGSFDNQIVCTTEKEVFCVESVIERLKRAMGKSGGYELSPSELRKLEKVIFEETRGPGKPGVINRKLIGKSANVIAAEIGLKLGTEVRMLFAEVPIDHPLVWTEQMMPVMPVARIGSVDEGIELAVRAEHGFRHTAVMHSKNVDALSKMARAMDCSIFVKNGSSLAGLGAGGEGFTSMSIASPTGEGMTRARSFVRFRRCVLVDRFRIV